MLYTYKAIAKRVIDGDTLDVILDLGFKIYKADRLRLYGINTPEVYGKKPGERELAAEATEVLRKFCADAEQGKNSLAIISEDWEEGKFGRILATLIMLDEHGIPIRNYNEEIVAWMKEKGWKQKKVW